MAVSHWMVHRFLFKWLSGTGKPPLLLQRDVDALQCHHCAADRQCPTVGGN
jgi:hypothetical protein